MSRVLRMTAEQLAERDKRLQCPNPRKGDDGTRGQCRERMHCSCFSLPSTLSALVISPIEPPKPSKYHSEPTEVDGIRFASKKEARRYGELKLLEAAGEIENLKLQFTVECIVNSVLVCKYIVDYSYLRGGHLVWEDVKGYRTPVYKLKRKLVKACTGIEITET